MSNSTKFVDQLELEIDELKAENKRLRMALATLAKRGCLVDSLIASITLGDTHDA